MRIYESLAAFQRQCAKLDAAQRAAFLRAVAVFIADLKAGEGFSSELRVHKLVNTEIWSLTWAKDGRALFRFGAEITPGQTHIIWEAIGTRGFRGVTANFARVDLDARNNTNPQKRAGPSLSR